MSKQFFDSLVANHQTCWRRLRCGLTAVAIALSTLLVASPVVAEDGLDQAIIDAQIKGRTAPIPDAETLRAMIEYGKLPALQVLDPKALQRFKETAVFTEFGLASMESAVLKGLSLSEAYQFLKLFGWEDYTLSFIDEVEIRDQQDRELLEALKDASSLTCEPELPYGAGGEPKLSIGEQDQSLRCYDPRCILQNKACQGGCRPWNGATCNICKC
ncbi:MAG: hypothetical protein Kow0020_16350 [Wenzhouxiangellaceae bacterium]